MQVDVVNAGLRDDSGNEELLALKAELDEAISLLKETVDEMRPAKPAPKPREPTPPPVKEKWSRENHPAFKKAAASAQAATPPSEEPVDVAVAPVSYQVNDTVMAKWVSGDKGFYAARITSITGSSTDPIYIVKFKSYDESDQVRGKDIRPIAPPKRKADDAPMSAAPAASAAQASAQSTASTSLSSAGVARTTSSNPGVISAAASIDLDLAKKSREAADVNAADAKPKAKKIRATKELETGKKSWQEFNTKSKFAKATKNKKDSMFRTPEGAHGRGKSRRYILLAIPRGRGV